MTDVLLVSVKDPGVTKLVAPAYADILVDKLGLYRRADVVAGDAQATPPPSPAKPPRKKRTYRRRDLKAEE